MLAVSILFSLVCLCAPMAVSMHSLLQQLEQILFPLLVQVEALKILRTRNCVLQIAYGLSTILNIHVLRAWLDWTSWVFDKFLGLSHTSIRTKIWWNFNACFLFDEVLVWKFNWKVVYLHLRVGENKWSVNFHACPNNWFPWKSKVRRVSFS